MKFFNSGYILSNKRHGWIDYDRGISIILVTYRHCFESLERSGVNLNQYPFLEYINVYLSGFRMPLFFIASGIFVSRSLQKRGLPAYINNRVKTILYPLLVWGVIQISLQIFFSAYTNSEMNAKSFLYLIIDPRRTGQFWYLNALFCVGVLYSFCKIKLHLKLGHQLILGSILYVILNIVRSYHINLGFAMDILQYYVFFALGDAVSQFMMNTEKAKYFSSWKLFIPLFIVFLIVQYFFTKLNLQNGDTYFVEHDMPYFFLLVAVIGCAFSICISFTMSKFNIWPFIRVVGYHSVHIYCVQIIAISIVRLFLVKVAGVSDALLLTLIVWPAAIFICMVVYNTCLRLNMWWLFSLKYPEEELNYIAQNKKSVIQSKSILKNQTNIK